MRLRILFVAIIVPLCLLTSCSEHLISDKQEREIVEKDFESRRAKLDAKLFQIFEQKLNRQEKDALTFLYAYMPLGDIVDHSGTYFLDNIDASFKAKTEMPWGKNIPEREFRHFVLPIRVNNENLDDSRKIFYEELKDRVKGMSLYDAILEVNHWCHEKVNYRPSDSRTSSPLATVKTAYGRCGEESTFTVAALRSVCIPARQVYTPRWAHTDDNHAWVEAWVDGKWMFLGACEPEPVLNLAWFNEPASRGMLMHTKVFGHYNGPEEVMKVTPIYTEINVINNYAPTAKMEVNVVDENGKPVLGATVEYKLYNYAEFYSVATKITNKEGKSYLTAGLGDMLVWASKNGKFGYKKVSFGKESSILIQLNKQVGKVGEDSFDIDMTPPVQRAFISEVTADQRAENDKRLAHEDSIRNAYVATFTNEESAREFAKKNGLDEDAVARILVASRGNYETLMTFMQKLHSDKSKKGGIDLLKQLTSKDLRDVKLDVLVDHMQSHYRIHNADYFSRFVRNPRISNELLTPYQTFFDKQISENDQKSYLADPFKLVDWVKRNIKVDADCNLGGAPISPVGVWKLRVADEHSRDIFFVALARSIGIPARINQVTRKVQIIAEDKAIDVNFEQKDLVQPEAGIVVADYKPISYLNNPKYYNHFTISRLTDRGSLQLLNYDEGDVDMGEGATFDNLLKHGTFLTPGEYLIVSGTRLANGTVLSHSSFFTVKPKEKTHIELVIREAKDDVKVIGSFNSESIYKALDGEKKSVLATTGRGYFVIGILGVGQEPTNHALRDIATLSTDFEKWGKKLVLLFPNEEQAKKFKASDFGDLPSTISYGIDINGTTQKHIMDELKLTTHSLPVFIVADTFNRVVFVSQGYTIGLGEQLMNIIHKL